jgi:hypothetical protein
MRTAKITRHQLEVADLIESVGDAEVQFEMKQISKQYAQVLAALRLAKHHLAEIEAETGMDHQELNDQIVDVYKHTKSCEIGLLEMCSNY